MRDLNKLGTKEGELSSIDNLKSPFQEKSTSDKKKFAVIINETSSYSSDASGENVSIPTFWSKINPFTWEHLQNHTQRRLKQRHVDLISIGGSIGTARFVTISSSLIEGGCGNLFIAFTIHGFIIYVVTLTIGELICYLPVDSPFITHAGRFVDPAFEVTCGYNFYFMSSMNIPYEITSLNLMIHYWRADYNAVDSFIPQMIIYLFLNIFAVNYYGESEFILAIGKLILAIGLLFFTFITMVGGNPQHDAFGFRNFRGVNNAFPSYLGSGALAFWQAYCNAVFTEDAPEYLGMVAGEAENPRKTMPRAFKGVVYRLTFFYVLGALSVGIILNRNDSTLLQAVADDAAGANVSPYVIAMKNMNIKVLPHIVNVLCMTSTFSAGNSYIYCSSRALYGLSKRGYAPKLFSICLKNGVPIFGIILACGWSCLSLLQLGDNASVGLDWLINLTTGCQVLNYLFMMITYLFFYRACKAQGLNRFTMPLQSWMTKLQPYPAIFGLVTTFLIMMFLGVSGFIPVFDVDEFLYYYLVVFVDVSIFVG